MAGELAKKHRIITAYTLNNPNVIRLEPPLTVTTEDIDYVVSALDEVLGRFKSFMGAALSSAASMVGSLLRGKS